MRLVLVALLCLTVPAQAGHLLVPRDIDKQLARLHAMVCQPKGAVLLSIEHAAEADGERVPLWTLAIYQSGAWRRTVWTAAGPRVIGACLTGRQQGFLYDRVRAIRWHADGEPRCSLALPLVTTYFARGKQRRIARPCDPPLDDASEQELAEIDAVIEASRRKAVE
jgi:hypothetical protein